jgi:hypothetical protein
MRCSDIAPDTRSVADKMSISADEAPATARRSAYVSTVLRDLLAHTVVRLAVFLELLDEVDQPVIAGLRDADGRAHHDGPVGNEGVGEADVDAATYNAAHHSSGSDGIAGVLTPDEATLLAVVESCGSYVADVACGGRDHVEGEVVEKQGAIGCGDHAMSIDVSRCRRGGAGRPARLCGAAASSV